MRNNALRQVSSPMVLVPAYGKRYNTVEDMLKDWRRGIDFLIVGGSYASIRDWEALLYTSSSVTLSQRHNNLSVTL
jgi:hypothetical protein